MSVLKKYLPLLLAAFLLVVLTVLSLLSEGYHGGTDNINHYFLSRFAYQNPHLYLDAWGRPLYTILSSPFSQFGFHGTRLFNVFLGVLTAWYAFRIARKFDLRPAWLVMIFVCFMPLYCVMLFTGLTEILFGFVLVLSVYLFLRGHYIASAVVISFLPFARTEGYLILPVLFLALWIRKQYRAWPFLAFGFVLFSIIGSFYHKDIFWVVTKFPYPVTHGHPIYKEAGALWHFLENRYFIIGLPLQTLFLAGLIQTGRDLFSKEKKVSWKAFDLALLVFMPVFIYLALHSVLYWKAMGGSMGFVRVLAGILPLAAILSLKGFDALANVLRLPRWLYIIALVLTIFLVVRNAFKTYEIPVPLDPEEKTIKKASLWYKNSPYAGGYFFFTDLNVPFFMDINPYRYVENKLGWFFYVSGIYALPDSAILIYDTHFGPNECEVPIDTILDNPRLRLIRYFRPEKPWTTLGGHDYEVFVMMNLPGRPRSDNRAIRDSLINASNRDMVRTTLYRNAFESAADEKEKPRISTQQFFSGTHSFRMDSLEFSPGLWRPISEIKGVAGGNQVQARAWVLMQDSIQGTNASLVITLEHNGEAYFYSSLYLEKSGLQPGHWGKVSLSAILPPVKSKNDILKVYLWNPGKRMMYLDDLGVELLLAKEE